MTAYIPPIDNPEAIFTVNVLRYDPEHDREPHWESFRIPWVKTMTAMEALEYLWDQGEYIAFRANCREFTCGSCAMLMNGKPGVACDTPLVDGMRIEPLSRYRVLKDLVVDTNPVKNKWRELELWPQNRDLENYTVTMKQIDSYRHVYARCIECYSCLDACPASDTEESEFAGPMWMLQIARSGAHPMNGINRPEQASQQGIWNCVNCYECEDVCPVELSPVTEIQKLRGQAVRGRLRRLLPF